MQFHTPTAREVARRSRVRRLRAAIRLVSWAALVTACYWLAEAGELLGVPAAQLICSLAVGAALALGVATLLTIAICAAIAVALARTSGVSTTEAVLGMAPGGSAAIISTAAELDADSRTVAAAQYLRVAMIALVAPLVVAVVAGGAEGRRGGGDTGARTRVREDQRDSDRFRGAVAGGCARGRLYRRRDCRSLGEAPLCPAAGPAVGRNAAHPHQRGTRFRSRRPRPGGINAVLATTATTSTDVPLVSTVQSLRLVIVILTVPLLLRWLTHISDKHAPPAEA